MMPPMAAGAHGGEDKEHKRAGYVEDDGDIWRVEGRIAPPVIGEERGGA